MSLALARLLHLASPALPVGAFSYSQGLEWAVECGAVTNEECARQWIADVLHFAQARCEAPFLIALMRAWSAADPSRIRTLNDEFIATRESAEFRAETLQMGYSLARLLRDLPEMPDAVRDTLATLGEIAYPRPRSCRPHRGQSPRLRRFQRPFQRPCCDAHPIRRDGVVLLPVCDAVAAHHGYHGGLSCVGFHAPGRRRR